MSQRQPALFIDMRQFNMLSKKDILNFLDIIESLLRCNDERDFVNIMFKFRDYINLEYIVCGHTKIEDLIIQQKLIYESINISYPEEYLDVYVKDEHYKNDHIINDYYKSFKIQRWKNVEERHEPETWRNVVQTSVDFGLVDGFTFGTRDDDGINGTCFFIADKKVDNVSRTTQILEHAVPHLSECLKKVLKMKSNKKYNLTKKEREILEWLKEGKSSWEISIILNRSERVINFHINNIMVKLNSMNRTHAVAKAIQYGLIQI